jgi:hypothetical protein
LRTKYNAIRTYSELCQRWFDSKAEAQRGEELAIMEKAGEISDLQYQVKFILCDIPRSSITIDFAYRGKESRHPDCGYITKTYEDVKGILTRDFRTKLNWLNQKYGIDVKLIR